ncbi:hypothetical protein JCM21900_002539 [Sporobolomyces salmonicolor]
MSDSDRSSSAAIPPLPPLPPPPPNPPPSRHPRASSAFSRLANIALSSSGSTVGSTSSSPASAPAPAPAAPRALDALETIANADHGRKRHGSTDSPLSEAGLGGTGAGAAARYAGYGGAGWRTRESSSSRSRDRGGDRNDPSSSLFGGASGGSGGGPPYIESPGGMSFRGGGGGGGGGSGNNSYWGMEVLPPNASASAVSSYAGGSAFSSSMLPGESHFFSPGPGASGFSFEGSLSGQGGARPYWDASYRSSVTGSPSLFGAAAPSSRYQPPLQPRTTASSSDGSRAGSRQPQLWDLPPSISMRSDASSSHIRTSSPVGGGRKLKDASRGLRYSVTTVSWEKGLVGLAKPPKEAEQGRVVVAGRTCLKLLKVPHAPLPHRSRTSSYISAPFPSAHHPTSSIAYRRSRSRGSPAPLDRHRLRDESVEKGESAEKEAERREEVLEIMDVRLGSRLGAGYLFTDVRWGYGATSNKLATSFTNGAVVLWDLAKEGGSHLDQLKYEHDRSVNRVVFGGQTGNWLMSGGQDGQLKLWDIRESRPASMILKASSPVLHLSFSPSSSQPFTLLAACASGTLIRYDVRYISRQNGGATDRIAGHIGSCLAMDWRDGFDCERPIGGAGGNGSTPVIGVSQETAGGGREGGWVVTGGVDSTIKIWDFSLPTLSTKPARTLYPSQPVQAVAWHPTRGTELASSPLPSLSLGAEGSASGAVDEVPNMPASIENPLGAIFKSEGGALGGGNAWKNEIEVWDTRRPYFPKFAIKTEEPMSALLFNDDETVWSTSKASATFHQHDTASDSYSLLDCVDRVAASWNLEGDVVFVDDARYAHDVPFERPSRKSYPVDSAKFHPDVCINTVSSLDPDFSTDSFVDLANSLVLTGGFREICDTNAEACFLAGRPDAAQIWATMKTWFSDEPFLPPDSPPLTPPEPIDADKTLPAVAMPLSDWLLSPTSASTGEASSKIDGFSRPNRPSFSSLRNNFTSRRASLEDTPTIASVALPPTDQSKQHLDAFSEESDHAAQSPYYPELSSTSSDSEHELIVRARRLNAASTASLNQPGPTGGAPMNRLVASLSTLGTSERRRPRSPTTALDAFPNDEFDLRLSQPASMVQSRRNSSSSSSGSDLEGDPEASVVRRSRSAKIAAMHASLIVNRSRRPSVGQSNERRPPPSRESTSGGGRIPSRQQSTDGAVNTSRRGSVPLVGRVDRYNSIDSCAGRKSLAEQNGAASRALRRQAGREHAAGALEVITKQLKATLQDYADRGDAQLCATVCCVLRDKELGFEPMWVARVTKTYLDLLRRLKLHVAAATLNKYCTTESLRTLTQNSVLYHTACGRCGKGLEQPPYGYCANCTSQATRCCVCHLMVSSLYVFCATCGHGAHADCLAAFASSISTSLIASQPQTPVDISHPSTPGIATPLRNWLWCETEPPSSPIDENERLDLTGEAAATNLRQLASMCPSGTCHHSPCLLMPNS